MRRTFSVTINVLLLNLNQISIFSLKLSSLSIVNSLTYISEIIKLVLLGDRETAQLTKCCYINSRARVQIPNIHIKMHSKHCVYNPSALGVEVEGSQSLLGS